MRPHGRKEFAAAKILRTLHHGTSRQTGGSQFTGSEFTTLFGIYVLEFIHDRNIVIICEMAVGLALTEPLDDTKECNYVDLNGAKWLIAEVWASNGCQGEEESRYYATDEATSHKWLTDLYTYSASGRAPREEHS